MTIHTYPTTKTVDQLRASIMADVAQLLVNDLLIEKSEAPWSIGGNVVDGKGRAFSDTDSWIEKIQRAFNDTGTIAYCFGRLMCMRQQLQEIGILVEIGGQDDHAF